MRDASGWERDGFSGFRVPADARGAMVQRKAAESSNLDALASGQGAAHLLKQRLDDQFHVAFFEMRL
jgi:hypothetical protein